MAERTRTRHGADRVNVALLTLAGFLAVLALLASQLHAPAAHRAPRRVLLRKIYETKVDERVIGRAAHGGASSSSESSTLAGASAEAPAVATRTS